MKKKFTALDALKIIGELKESDCYVNTTYEYETVETPIKALEIIKEKRVNVGSFIKCCANIDYEEYINGWSNWKKDILYNLSSELLTQEEFDLLKEVLL